MKIWTLFLGALVVFSFCMKAQADGLNPLLESSIKYKKMRVESVRAVDLVLMENGDKVALIGIKGPRPPRMKDARRDDHGFIIPEDNPVVPLEDEALRFARGLCEGRLVHLEFDTSRRDNDGNLLAYVILPDGRLLNAELVRMGYAAAQLVPPNMKYADKIRAAYQEARRELRGLQGEW
ncbi:MAG: thermonuclease family protein [Candidatus Omnitrophota bacterium]